MQAGQVGRFGHLNCKIYQLSFFLFLNPLARTYAMIIDTIEQPSLCDPTVNRHAFLEALSWVWWRFSPSSFFACHWPVLVGTVSCYAIRITAWWRNLGARLAWSTGYTWTHFVHTEPLRISVSLQRKSIDQSLPAVEFNRSIPNPIRPYIRACKFRFDLAFPNYKPAEIARKTPAGFDTVSSAAYTMACDFSLIIA